jgi:hypothetical protein
VALGNVAFELWKKHLSTLIMGSSDCPAGVRTSKRVK